MALSNRDIVITPNRGASTEPLIRFTGADASSSATITLRVINSSTVGTLSFEGSSGQLLSVTDSMVGTIFSVNDVSGIPSIEVLDTGAVKLAQYNGWVNISTATSLFSAKLTVQGNSYFNGVFTATSAQITTGLSVGATAPSATAGEIRATNEITAYYSSDARLKENVRLISDPITMLEQIRGVYFDWTAEHIKMRGGEDGYFVRKHDIGVIAQEIEAVLPEIVATRDNGYKAVKYEKIVPLLIEAIKAQQRQIDQILGSLETLTNK